MTRHIYAYGSLVRGEIDVYSDFDILAIAEGESQGIDAGRFSVYTRQRIEEIWQEGNPFAWHLHLESRLLFASNGRDILRELHRPHDYNKAEADCLKFHKLYDAALASFNGDSGSRIFDLSTMFLAIRNFATCYRLGVDGIPDFSRDIATRMDSRSVPVPPETYKILWEARALATRGIGQYLDLDQANSERCFRISRWKGSQTLGDWRSSGRGRDVLGARQGGFSSERRATRGA